MSRQTSKSDAIYYQAYWSLHWLHNGCLDVIKPYELKLIMRMLSKSVVIESMFESFILKMIVFSLVGVRQCDRDSLMETGIRVDQEHPVPK